MLMHKQGKAGMTFNKLLNSRSNFYLYVDQSKWQVGRPTAAFSKTLRNIFSAYTIHMTDRLEVQNQIK